MTTRNRLDNPLTDKYEIVDFHHLEFYVDDVNTAVVNFKASLGMKKVAHSCYETGNHTYRSDVLKCQNIVFVITSPYGHPTKNKTGEIIPHPEFNSQRISEFVKKHGNGVGVIGFIVKSVDDAYECIMSNNDAKNNVILSPTIVDNKIKMCEVLIYGDTILRLIENLNNYDGIFLPGYQMVNDSLNPETHSKLYKIDHVVGNVFSMDKTVNYIKRLTGMHTFAKFSKEDIQTEWTSLNSEVLANNGETVLLPINEAVTKKYRSQIEEYLDANCGEGVQHIAIKSKNIFETISWMRSLHKIGVGFDFIPTLKEYYDHPKVKSILNELGSDYESAIRELGILVDKDEEGILLQIFTKPLFDRPTLFIEIIQRKCSLENDVPGCGGFGKGNFKALFETIERMQKNRNICW